MEEIRERFWNVVDAVLYHHAIESFMYNPRVRLVGMRMFVFITFFACVIFNQAWIALIITFSMVVSQWGN